MNPLHMAGFQGTKTAPDWNLTAREWPEPGKRWEERGSGKHVLPYIRDVLGQEGGFWVYM